MSMIKTKKKVPNKKTKTASGRRARRFLERFHFPREPKDPRNSTLQLTKPEDTELDVVRTLPKRKQRAVLLTMYRDSYGHGSGEVFVAKMTARREKARASRKARRIQRMRAA